MRQLGKRLRDAEELAEGYDSDVHQKTFVLDDHIHDMKEVRPKSLVAVQLDFDFENDELITACTRANLEYRLGNITFSQKKPEIEKIDDYNSTRQLVWLLREANAINVCSYPCTKSKDSPEWRITVRQVKLEYIQNEFLLPHTELFIRFPSNIRGVLNIPIKKYITLNRLVCERLSVVVSAVAYKGWFLCKHVSLLNLNVRSNDGIIDIYSLVCTQENQVAFSISSGEHCESVCIDHVTLLHDMIIHHQAGVLFIDRTSTKESLYVTNMTVDSRMWISNIIASKHITIVCSNLTVDIFDLKTRESVNIYPMRLEMMLYLVKVRSEHIHVIGTAKEIALKQTFAVKNGVVVAKDAHVRIDTSDCESGDTLENIIFDVRSKSGS